MTTTRPDRGARAEIEALPAKEMIGPSTDYFGHGQFISRAAVLAILDHLPDPAELERPVWAGSGRRVAWTCPECSTFVTTLLPPSISESRP